MIRKSFLYFSFILLSSFTVDVDVYDDVAGAIRSGNAGQVSNFFASNVDLTILTQENVYSKAQAEVIIRDFFSKNIPKTFTIIHRGTSKDGALYAIGNLETTGGSTFRTYFFVRQANGKSIIQELRFEKE